MNIIIEIKRCELALSPTKKSISDYQTIEQEKWKKRNLFKVKFATPNPPLPFPCTTKYSVLLKKMNTLQIQTNNYLYSYIGI